VRGDEERVKDKEIGREREREGLVINRKNWGKRDIYIYIERERERQRDE
jgi:hypothetical protein